MKKGNASSQHIINYTSAMNVPYILMIDNVLYNTETLK